jgi:putative protease
MKSAGYVGCVVGAYRAMLDAVLEGGTDASANVKAAALLKNDFARQKTVFHFDGRESANAASWLNPAQDGGTGVRLGRIDRTRADGGVIFALIKPVSEFSGTDAPASGDSIRIHRADDSERSAHKIKRVEYNADGSFWIDIPAGFSVGDNVYLISKKETSRRCRPVAQNSDDGKGGSRRPGFEKAPYEKIPAVKRSTKNDFPEGLYVSVSRIEDMYAAQSVKPALIIISASVKVINRLTGEKKALPFSPAETVLSLPPFFAENSAASYEAALPKLIEAGYSRYMINNLAHISLLKNKNVLSICGPYLYTFNRAAVSFLAGHQLRFFVTPLENNRQNLERTFTEEERGGVFVTVFAYPRLFRICGVNGFYDFGEFSDSRGEQFKLVNEDETSSVIPAKPFSIIDKIPFLKRSGFRRFIIDFSGEPLLKQRYKNIMKAANNCSLVDGASRFNWKDGFFTTED